MDSSQLSTRAHTLITAVLSVYRLHRGLFYSFLSDARRHQLQLHPVQPDGARFRAAALCDIQSVLLFADEPVPSIHPARSTHCFMRNSLRGADACSVCFSINLPLVSRMAVFISGVLDTVFICAKHYVVLRAYTALHRSGIYQRNTLLIGEGPTAQRYASTVLGPAVRPAIIWWAMSPRGRSSRAARVWAVTTIWNPCLPRRRWTRPSSLCPRTNTSVWITSSACAKNTACRCASFPAMRNASATRSSPANLKISR